MITIHKRNQKFWYRNYVDDTNVEKEKNIDDNVINQELMKRNSDGTSMKEKPDEYVTTNKRKDNTNVEEKTHDDARILCNEMIGTGITKETRILILKRMMIKAIKNNTGTIK